MMHTVLVVLILRPTTQEAVAQAKIMMTTMTLTVTATLRQAPTPDWSVNCPLALPSAQSMAPVVEEAWWEKLTMMLWKVAPMVGGTSG